MSTLGSNVATLSDWAKRLDPDGSTSTIVELLGQTNEILPDMLWMEGNLPTGHRTTVRTGLPSVAWRLLNGGITPSKSTTAQIDEACGMLEAYSEVDKDLAELNGNTAQFRLSEGQAFVESMNQEMAGTVFYGNSGTAPEEFTGLATRYSSLSAGNGQNILDAQGNDTDLMSIWLVVWGANTVHGIFPKGSKAGLIHEDLGLVTVETANGIGGGRMRAYRDHWQWKCGIALRDWRYAVRIANIDKSALTSESSAANLTKYMIKAIHRVQNIRMGRPVFYMNRTTAQMLDIQRYNVMSGMGTGSQNLGGSISYEQVNGVWTPNFRGIPIRICDALLESESRVT